MPEFTRCAHDQGLRMTRRLALVLLVLTTACVSATSSGANLAMRRSTPITRELALLTFDSAWSRIAHTHYDTALGGVDWHAVRTELRPRAESATTLDELRGVISTMLGRLRDSHYGLISRYAAAVVEVSAALPGPALTGVDVGAELRLVDADLLVWQVDPDGPAARAGVRMVSRVVPIDGTPLQPPLDVVAALP